jgi:hypothetical protein
MDDGFLVGALEAAPIFPNTEGQRATPAIVPEP